MGFLANFPSGMKKGYLMFLTTLYKNGSMKAPQIWA